MSAVKGTYPLSPKKWKKKKKRKKGKKSSQYKTKATPGWILKYANQLLKGSWLWSFCYHQALKSYTLATVLQNSEFPL